MGDFIVTVIGIIVALVGAYLVFGIGTTLAIVVGIIMMILGFAISGAFFFLFDGDIF